MNKEFELKLLGRQRKKGLKQKWKKLAWPMKIDFELKLK